MWPREATRHTAGLPFGKEACVTYKINPPFRAEAWISESLPHEALARVADESIRVAVARQERVGLH